MGANPSDGPGDGVELAEALEELRGALAEAQARAAEQDVQFPIQTLTVELQVVVTRSRDGKAGFRVPVVGAELGGSVGHERQALQTLTVVLGPPLDRLGRPIRVSEEREGPRD
jgi:hypothetical protein